MNKCLHQSRWHLGWKTTAFVLTTVGMALPASAVELISGPDWAMRWDNTLQYNLGVRAQNIDSRIGDDPIHAESDYKFDSAGDIVTDRIALLSEFDLNYQRKYGLHLSGSGWKDFAYNDKAKTNPGYLIGPDTLFPGFPGATYSSNYDNARYSSYTKRFYVEGAQLLDAFVFGNFDLADHPITIRAGRLTQYWGNGLFFGGHAISYSQSPSDLIKAAATPGTQTKELSLPRAQINIGANLAPNLSLDAQYFFEFYGDRLPEGGTYLGPVDFAFQGPDQFGALGLPRTHEREPDNVHDNFGIALRWSPAWANGTIGFYGRRFDEVRAWLLGDYDGSGALTGYHLGYATGVKLFGISYDTTIGAASTGFEVSYRDNTALNTVGLAPEGVRGQVLNVVANALVGLTPTALYDTGTVLFEAAYQHKVGVTKNESYYNGVDTANCTLGKFSGCSTDNELSLAFGVTPQWLQVLPGVDLDMPLIVLMGASGNAAGLSSSFNQGDIQYSAGFHALIRQRYNLSLSYNDGYGRTAGLTNAGAAAGMPIANGTPGFATYYAGGSNLYMTEDRGWVSLSFSTTF